MLLLANYLTDFIWYHFYFNNEFFAYELLCAYFELDCQDGLDVIKDDINEFVKVFYFG